MKSREELIESGIPVVKKSVTYWLCRNPKFYYLRDDFESHGFVKLIDIVDRFRQGKIQNFKGYLRLSLLTAFWDVVRENNMFKLRDTSTKQMFAGDHQFPGQGFIDRLLASGFAKEFPGAVYSCRHAVRHTEAVEALSEACQDDEDALLVSMLKVRRVSDRQAKGLDAFQLEQLEVEPIARELGVTPLEVQERAGQILARFRRIYYDQYC